QAGAQLGHVQFAAVRNASAGTAEDVLAPGALEPPVQVVDLDAPVAAVGNAQLGLGAAVVHPQPMRAVESAGCAFGAVEAAEVAAVPVVAVDVVHPVAVGYPDAAVAAETRLVDGHPRRRVASVAIRGQAGPLQALHRAAVERRLDDLGRMLVGQPE